MPNNRLFITLLLLLAASFHGISQNNDFIKSYIPFHTNGLTIYQLNADSSAQEKQNIVVAEYLIEAHHPYKISIAYSDSILRKTSSFGEDSKALVAINGGFFDVEKGGSVAYLESEGKVISQTRKSKEKWAKTDSLLNGAVIIDTLGNLKIERSKSADFYERSSQEKAVMVTGPILLVDGKVIQLENSDFVKKRHPRSCLCKTSDQRILFIAIDGRSNAASGMNLFELQKFLIKSHCKEAINLDGGGSTTLWVNDGIEKRILNHPSDKSGERPVANIFYIK
ncbi:MAG: phosphodiester glycosidase family protein [Prolixibacteraceae bacterium]|jgi:exopolysaccharide biosynthesis protein|nr:phosphodiester glycosidase family protein [Prolixibacteraceae bacterium]